MSSSASRTRPPDHSRQRLHAVSVLSSGAEFVAPLHSDCPMPPPAHGAPFRLFAKFWTPLPLPLFSATVGAAALRVLPARQSKTVLRSLPAKSMVIDHTHPSSMYQSRSWERTASADPRGLYVSRQYFVPCESPCCVRLPPSTRAGKPEHPARMRAGCQPNPRWQPRVVALCSTS